MTAPILDKHGLIEKIANNKTNRETMTLNPISEIKKKLDYYRQFFGRIQDLQDTEFEELKHSITTFFNLKPLSTAATLPQFLVRISNNNRILKAQGKEIGYLTDIDQLLAPPVGYCTYGRCNLPKQQVAYCALDEVSAYWETKPQNGDVITISRFLLKPGARGVCSVIKTQKEENPNIAHELQEVFYTLDEFFIDAFAYPVDRERPRDYLFSALLSSEQMFYPVKSDGDLEAILYPSIQRKKMGDNFAIKNDLFLKKYDLHSVETKFILDEYENLDPSIAEPTTDCVIGSFGTTAFDFENGKILYTEKADELFRIFRNIQTGSGKQVRINNGPGVPKNIVFNLAPPDHIPSRKPFVDQTPQSGKLKYGRNDKVSVEYINGTRVAGVKYKNVEPEILKGRCKVVEFVPGSV